MNIKEKNQSKFANPSFVITVIIVVLLGLVFFLSFQIIRIKQDDAKDDKKIEEMEKQKTFDKVSKLLYFESKKDFTLATIKDIEGLKQQDPEFYKNAENGDKILVFDDRAIIYREKNNLIINVSKLAGKDNSQ